MERTYLPAIAEYIDRPRVNALVRRGLEYTLVYVVAGPGYGKTLSVAHNMRTADVRLIWLRMSSIRTTAADFWEDLVRAVRRELPAFASKLDEFGLPDAPGSFERLRGIAAETAEAGKRLVLVVDNYERILDDGIAWFLNNLADGGLPNFTLYILCNVMLPFATVLPATGQFRITGENLAFTLDEARMMYRQYGADVPQAVLERAVKATGGWPLGLRLVCQSSPENPEFFSSRSLVQIAADLFEQHYFHGYARDVQAQLVLFSLLPQFSIDMAWEGAETPRDALAHILMQHPFISYDYGSGLYLYQTMYHDFLRQRQTLLSVELRTKTLALAGRWFLAHHMAQEAMDCFWDAADYDGFMESVSLLPKVRKPVDITNRILQRLEQIPRSYADGHIEVDYSIAFMHLNAANVRRARALFLEVVDRLLAAPGTEETRLLLGDTYAVLADISTYLGEDTGLGWMKKAYEQVPNGTRCHAPELLALENNSVFFLPSTGPGQAERMVEYFFEYAKYADKVKNGCGMGYDYLYAGEAAYYREDMDHAAAMFNSAIIKARQTDQHDIICSALWDLGRIELYYGNYKNALAVFNEIESYVNDNQLVGMYELRDCAVAYLHMRLGDADSVPVWFGDTTAGPGATAFAFARRLLAGAYYLYMKGNNAKAFALLFRLEALMEAGGCWTERLLLYILKARLHMAAKRPEAFALEFGKIYPMVYANNLKLLLSGFGKEMTAMLDYLKKLDVHAYDSAWLDAVYEDAVSMAKRVQMMRAAYKDGDRHHRSSISLTRREDETLRFLAQGLTQKEIGRLMGISENAVKKHISKIYFKLGAVNRADAIHIATVNGLVDVISG